MSRKTGFRNEIFQEAETPEHLKSEASIELQEKYPQEASVDRDFEEDFDPDTYAKVIPFGKGGKFRRDQSKNAVVLYYKSVS